MHHSSKGIFLYTGSPLTELSKPPSFCDSHLLTIPGSFSGEFSREGFHAVHTYELGGHNCGQAHPLQTQCSATRNLHYASRVLRLMTSMCACTYTEFSGEHKYSIKTERTACRLSLKYSYLSIYWLPAKSSQRSLKCPVLCCLQSDWIQSPLQQLRFSALRLQQCSNLVCSSPQYQYLQFQINL